MSVLKKPINFKLLENELNNALRADELYKLQNDAKIRAVEQRVPTYDNFRDMVLAAHLRPLERSEMQKRAEVSWNHCYNKSDESVTKAYGRSKQLVPKVEERGQDCWLNLQPQTSADFLKIWKNLSDSQQKFDYVFHFRSNLKTKFFKVEVPPEFLEEFFRVSLEICSIDTDLQIIEILKIFSECNRISLSFAMMANKEKQAIQFLFKKLLSLVQSHDELGTIKKLMKIFGVQSQ